MKSKTIALQIFQAKISDVHLESVLNTLDRLHDASTENRLGSETTVDAAQVVGWLEDIIFTAQETLKELQDECGSNEHINIPGTNTVLKLYRQG